MNPIANNFDSIIAEIISKEHENNKKIYGVIRLKYAIQNKLEIVLNHKLIRRCVESIDNKLEKFPFTSFIYNYEENNGKITNEMMLEVSNKYANQENSDVLLNGATDVILTKYGIDILKISNGKVIEYGGATPYAFYTKEKIIEIFGTDNNIFDNSFYYLIDGVNDICAGYSLLYDKNKNKMIHHDGNACGSYTGGESLLLEKEEKDDIYKFKYVYGYIIDNEKFFSLYDTKDGKLVKSNLDNNYLDTLDNILNENQEKLTKYEFTFKVVNNNSFKFIDINKIVS